MERKRFCVTFFLRRARISKAGLAPILARITMNGVSKEVYFQCSVPADRWNQTKEWATGRDKLCRQVNAYLNTRMRSSSGSNDFSSGSPAGTPKGIWAMSRHSSGRLQCLRTSVSISGL